MQDAFAPAEAEYKKRVMHATWGHLPPEEGKRCPGSILFAHGAYGDLVALRSDFPDVLDNPWFFDAMMEYICERKTKPGNIYRFEGYYVLQKNGKGRFSGKVRIVKI